MMSTQLISESEQMVCIANLVKVQQQLLRMCAYTDDTNILQMMKSLVDHLDAVLSILERN